MRSSAKAEASRCLSSFKNQHADWHKCIIARFAVNRGNSMDTLSPGTFGARRPRRPHPTPRRYAALALAALVCFAAATPVHAAISSEERQVLAWFYVHAGGTWWYNKTGWAGPPGTECDWYGVTCNGAGTHVRDIDLSNNNLDGRLPPRLSDLTMLERLNVSWQGCRVSWISESSTIG